MAALLLEHPGRSTARSSDSQHRVGPQRALLSLGKRKALGGNWKKKKKRHHLPNLPIYAMKNWNKCIVAEPTGGKGNSGVIK